MLYWAGTNADSKNKEDRRTLFYDVCNLDKEKDVLRRLSVRESRSSVNGERSTG